jgi:hypothetical protein
MAINVQSTNSNLFGKIHLQDAQSLGHGLASSVEPLHLPGNQRAYRAPKQVSNQQPHRWLGVLQHQLNAPDSACKANGSALAQQPCRADQPLLGFSRPQRRPSPTEAAGQQTAILRNLTTA